MNRENSRLGYREREEAGVFEKWIGHEDKKI